MTYISNPTHSLITIMTDSPGSIQTEAWLTLGLWHMIDLSLRIVNSYGTMLLWKQQEASLDFDLNVSTKKSVTQNLMKALCVTFRLVCITTSLLTTTWANPTGREFLSPSMRTICESVMFKENKPVDLAQVIPWESSLKSHHCLKQC